ncbi:ABC transporter permease [Curtobacterium sp. B18]|uniref:ABC transporter permease n=1 Tax=Curtobacterium sp. B18 TaxID=95614 RepID=UPI0003496E84|nr:ABC transporter permease [Curtobacterium sp. B18]
MSASGTVAVGTAGTAGRGAGPDPSTVRRGRRLRVPFLLAVVGAAYLAVFFVIPLVSGLVVSLMSGNPDDGYTFTWNWGVYGALFIDPQVPYLTFLGRSLWYGAAATVVTIIVGYPVAYFIAFRVSPRWKNPLLMLVFVSFLVSFVIRTDMWAFVLASQGPVVTTLQAIGLAGKDFHILGTGGAVVFGDAYNDLAFMVLPIYAALERIDPRLGEAANDLYAGKVRAFWHTTLPLSRSGIFAGVLLVFIDSVGDPVNSALLGGTNTYTIGQAIQDAYSGNQQYNVAAALSTVLMVVLGIILFIYARVSGTDDLEDLV